MDNRAITIPHSVRKRHRGANLALLCAMAVLLIGFMGITIFTGVQAFLESDLQRASMNAALAGAAAYYSGEESTGRPIPDPDQAKDIAASTFNTIVSNSSLAGFSPSIVNITNNDRNDSITISSKASVKTPLLAPLGISTFEVITKATARAFRYEPTQFLPNNRDLIIQPIVNSTNSYVTSSFSKILDLKFPLIDGPGNDLYVEQNSGNRQGYIVEACNEEECYNLVPGAKTVGSSFKENVHGLQVIYGTVIIDLADAGVRKATKLRFTHGNDYRIFSGRTEKEPPTEPTPLVIQRVMLLGYSGTCVDEDTCGIPSGLMPVN